MFGGVVVMEVRKIGWDSFAAKRERRLASCVLYQVGQYEKD